MAEQEAIGLLEQLARDFNVRDPRKLQQIARREFPDRRDLTAERARTARRRGRTSGCRRTWWTSRRTRGAPTGTAWW